MQDGDACHDGGRMAITELSYLLVSSFYNLVPTPLKYIICDIKFLGCYYVQYSRHRAKKGHASYKIFCIQFRERNELTFKQKIFPHIVTILPSGTDLLTYFLNFFETLDCLTYACNTDLPYLDLTVYLPTNSQYLNKFYLFFSP